MALVARDVMSKNLISVKPATTLVDLERLLLAKRIGGTPVIEDGELIGMVSRSDIVRVLTYEQSMAEVQSGAFHNELGISDRRAVELIGEQVGQRMQQLTVREAMTDIKAQVSSDTPVQQIAQLMVAQSVHRVLVTHQGDLLGIVSRSDLLRALAEGTATVGS